MSARALAFVATLLLCGCAATLDSAVTTTERMALPTSPETTYRNLVSAMRRCYFGPSIRVEGDYFPAAQSASLRLVWGNDVGVIEWLRIEVVSAPDGSQVTAVRRTAQDKFAPAWRAWAAGDSANCPYS